MSCSLMMPALLCLAGCMHSQPRLQSDDEAQHEKDRQMKTVGDYTTFANANPIPAVGVGLVVGLEGTGGRAPANGYRTMMEDFLKKKGVEHIKEILDSPNTSIVLVSAVVPAGAHRGDPVDLEITLPPQSSTTSLRGGYLKECLLYNTESTKHLHDVAHGQVNAPNFRGADRPLAGHAIVQAEGPLLVGFGSGDESARAKVGRIWGGGKCRIDRPFFLILNSDQQRAAMAQLISERINDSLHGKYHNTMVELASAKNNQLVVLQVPEQYKLNLPRFLRVVRLVPLRPAQGPTWPYRRQLENDLLDPKHTVTAALRLEALGSDSTEALKKGLKSDHTLVRFCSAESLAYLGESDCGDVLARMVTEQPMLRAFSLTALASLDENVCRVRLGELLGSNSSEARYGAFRALRALDEHEAAVEGEHLNESFWLHRCAPTSTGLVHLSHSRRPEVVLFGEDAFLKPPFSFLAGEFTITAGRDDRNCTITRLSLNRGTTRKQCKLQLEDVIRALAEMGATYPNVDEFLMQADRTDRLTCPLAVDALPQGTSVETLAKSGAEDPNFLKDTEEIRNARMDIGATPTLFEKTQSRSSAVPSQDREDELEGPRPQVVKPAGHWGW
jgi:hypothetical protein